jgi:hypothetical protein
LNPQPCRQLQNLIFRGYSHIYPRVTRTGNDTAENDADAAQDGRFPKGVSGNPRGSLSKAARQSRLAEIIAEWVAPHGGTAAFGAAELALLNRAAELRLLRPRNPLDGIRAANTVARILSLLGLVDGRTRQRGARRQRFAPFVPRLSMAV